MIRQENNGIEGFDVAELIFVYYTDELKLSKQSFSLVNNALTAKVSKYLQRTLLDTSLYFRLYFVILKYCPMDGSVYPTFSTNQFCDQIFMLATL